jgi:hypothetical protein
MGLWPHEEICMKEDQSEKKPRPLDEKMPRVPVTCYKIASKWNGVKVDVLYVPKYTTSEWFVGPGYWSPPRAKDVFAPRCKFHHKVYSKEDLLKAGVVPVTEALWR